MCLPLDRSHKNETRGALLRRDAQRDKRRGGEAPLGAGRSTRGGGREGVPSQQPEEVLVLELVPGANSSGE